MMDQSQQPRSPQTRPAVIVTGASRGIGRVFARIAAADSPVLLVARPSGELDAVAAEIAAGGGEAHVLALDLGQPGAAPAILAGLAERGLHAEIVVNNAAYGNVGRADEIAASEQLGQVDLNVRLLTELTLAVLPGMRERRRGGVLNVASVAAFLPGPGMATYYATKAYVQSFSLSLWQEMKPFGVTVTSLCPGPVHTGFLARATGATVPVQGRTTRFHVPAEAVAKAGWDGLKGGHHTVVPGFANWLVVQVARMVPQRITAALMVRFQGARARSLAAQANVAQ
jgi:hypothetical protein